MTTVMKRLGPWYMGCLRKRRPGHYVIDAQNAHVNYYTATSQLERPLDGGYPPQYLDKGDYSKRQTQGVACLTVEEDTTILAFWDRSADSRLGSHSTFVLPGVLDFTEAVKAARAAFPRIWERIDGAGVEVRL